MSLAIRLKSAYQVLIGQKSFDSLDVVGALFGSGRPGINGWPYKASKLLAEEVGSIPIRLYKVAGDGSWDEEDSHPLLDLLYRPNQLSTHAEFFEAISMHLDFYGNAYLYLEGVNDPKGKPKALYILDPKKVQIKRTETFPEKIVEYKYSHRGKEHTFKTYQVLHIRDTNPEDTLKGLGVIEAISDSVDMDEAARTWNRAFFKNSARPDLFLKATEQKTKEQLEQLRAQFEDKYRGAANAHKVAVLPKGYEPTPMGWNQKEMDFVEQMRWTRDDILSGLRTPHVVLGLGAGENLNRATAEATNYIYALRTVTPRMKRIVSFFNVFFVPRYGNNYILDFDDPVPQNEELAIQKRTAALAGAAYETVNEVRDEIGLPPIDGGDDVMGTFSQTPIGSPKQAKAKTRNTLKAYFPLKTQKTRKELDQGVSVIAEKATKILMQKLAQPTPEQKEARWRDFVSRVTPYENASKKAMEKYAEGMTERAVSNLEKVTKDIDPDVLLDSENEVSLIVDALKPIMEELSKNESGAAASIVGGTIDPESLNLPKLVGDAIGLMAESYQETTLDLLKSQLEEGIGAGEGIDELRHRIQSIGEFSSKVRAESVAMTESYRIANLSARETWKALGVEELVWYTAKDEAVCEFCGPMDGKVVGVNENYYDIGDTVQGRNGGALKVTYAPVTGGALHPNCRCQIVQAPPDVDKQG